MPQETNNFIDLHTRGIGYVNRLREVKVRKGPNFYACTIAALFGKKGEVEKTYIDVKVTGQKAEQSMKQLQEAVDNDQNVLIGFTISDIYAHPYTKNLGEGETENRAIVKGRLINVKWAKVNGEFVIHPEPRGEEVDAEGESEAEAQEAEA